MKIIETIAQIKEELKSISGKKIGLIPTMGYLHSGHLSLIKQSKSENDITVVSIFVNPTQFAPSEDLDTYPKDLKKDCELLENLNVDYLFYPSKNEIYLQDHQTYVKVSELNKVLCGKSRPTHFQGVTTIVLKLFNIIQPVHAYFGQKDAQQAIILKKMVKDLNLDISLKILPIIRDNNGLALSSRNKYLTDKERKAALILPGTLQKAKQAIINGENNSTALITEMRNELSNESLIKIDYLKIVQLDNLKDQKKIDPNNTLVAAAVKIGNTRLIDNFILGVI